MNFRCALVLLMLLCAAPAHSSEVSIGVDISEYPEMVLVPDYPVYYAPSVGANYFFYDGDFWMFQDDTWYRSPWYDGPWERVDPEDVPDTLLQVPVRYYVQPPAYFFSWWYEEPPHWGEHWGHDWERQRHGWREHRRHDRPAPLPDYQRDYSGDRYPAQIEQQRELEHRHYRYQARDPLTLQQRSRMPSVPRQTRDRWPEAGGAMQGSQPASPPTRGNPEIQRIPRHEGTGEQSPSAITPLRRSEAQPRSQQPRPEIHREERAPPAERVEKERPEHDAGEGRNRTEERERSRER